MEAPFTGSKPSAEQRATIYFLGGVAHTIDLVEQVLSRVSAKRFRVGTPEQAAALKLSMNLQIATVTQALVEQLFAREVSSPPSDFDGPPSEDATPRVYA